MYLHIPDNTDKINVIVRNHTLLPSNRPKHQFLTYTNEKEIAEFENLFKELQSSEKDHSLGFTTSKIICYKNNYEIQRFTFYTFNF